MLQPEGLSVTWGQLKQFQRNKEKKTMETMTDVLHRRKRRKGRRRAKRGHAGLRKARCVQRCRRNGGKLKGCRRKCHVKGKR